MSAKLYASRGSMNTYLTNIQVMISISETSTESTITTSIIITTTGVIIAGLITIETIFKVSKFYVEVEITMED